MNEPELLGQIARLTVIVHAASTWAMVGVILVIQVVHYPLFSSVGPSSFPAYEALHTQRITWIVGPLMLAELATAVFLAVRPPASVAVSVIWTGLALLAVIWISTAVVQIPLHGVLSDGFDETAHRKLLSTNWVRTAAWLLRGALAAIILYQYLSSSLQTR